jgi:hypothetical protein
MKRFEICDFKSQIFSSPFMGVLMKFYFLTIVLTAALLSGCGPRKPAYSDMKTDKDGRAVGQENNNQSGAGENTAKADSPPDTTAQPPQPTATQPPQPVQAPPKIPAFFDMATGQIKDVPSYPNAVRTNVQYGPIEGHDTALLVLQTRDQIEKIAAFYDKAAKTAGWTVVNQVKDTGFYKIEIKKGDRDEARIQAMRDERTGMVSIGLSRITKQPQPKQ